MRTTTLVTAESHLGAAVRRAPCLVRPLLQETTQKKTGTGIEIANREAVA